jgi:hypothetical protein
MGILKCSRSVLRRISEVAWRACQLLKEMWCIKILRTLRKSLPAEDLTLRLSDLCSPAKQKLMRSLWIWGSLFCSSFISLLQNLYSNREREEGDKSDRRGEWERGDTEGSLCSGLRLSHRACSQNEEAIETMFFFRSIDMLYLHRATKPSDWSYKPRWKHRPTSAQNCKSVHLKYISFYFAEVHGHFEGT